MNDNDNNDKINGHNVAAKPSFGPVTTRAMSRLSAHRNEATEDKTVNVVINDSGLYFKVDNVKYNFAFNTAVPPDFSERT
jgi:hypothetical protein